VSTFEQLQLLGWVGNVLSLIGAWKITRRQRSGFVFFMLSCLALMPPVIYAHVWNQVGLFAAYLVIDVVGFVRWRDK
jgi:hypothetical protein